MITVPRISIVLFVAFSAMPAVFGQAVPNDDGLATLYSRDAIAHTLCFEDGRYGHVVQGGEVKNRCSDLDFDNYSRLNFSSGVEGGREAAIIDIGTEDDLQTKYHYQQGYGATQGFSSITLKDHRLYIRGQSGERTGSLEGLGGANACCTKGISIREPTSGSLQEMSDVEQALAKLKPLANSTVQTGHIYLLHIGDRHSPDVAIWVKLFVVTYVPREFVTIRWQRL